MHSLRSLGITTALLAALAVGSVRAQAPPLRVIATYSILGDVVQNIAGAGDLVIELTVLVGTDGDTHSYEPVPQDSVRLGEADIVFENGLGFDSWLDDMYAASGSQAERVAISAGIPAGAIALGDEAGQTDPHIWQNPYYYAQAVGIVRDALSAADPAHAARYQLNANAYLTALLATDTYILEQVETLPVERRKFVTSHDAFGYFARRYGFEQVGFAIASVSIEGTGPSARDIALLVDSIRATGTTAVFPENTENAELIGQVAREAGVVVGDPLCSDALSPANGPCPTYLALLRHNIDTIVTTLRP